MRVPKDLPREINRSGGIMKSLEPPKKGGEERGLLAAKRKARYKGVRLRLIFLS
jgi:hypothetical protein